jgi:glycosyltransferase involved in cell wall biosynthesis
MSPARGVLRLVAPALDGAATGGTLYNRELCAALWRAGCELCVCSLDSAGLGELLRSAQRLWVDSLYLDAVPELARRAAGPLGLWLHYLPSFVALGRAARPGELSEPERRALAAADSLLVTSEFMREALEPLVATPQKIYVVAPGCELRLAPAQREAKGALPVVMIANLLPGKGIEPLLLSLAEELRPSDRLTLSIVGSLELDPGYSERCRRLIAQSPELAARVTLRGALSPALAQAELAEADLLLSASVMESYGMALAEARVAGVPILARAGGNAAAHVEPSAGGQLVATTHELATACLELARDPARRRERLSRAREHARPSRAWSEAASELLLQLASLEK